MARQLPAELLGDLEAHRLRSLSVVGAEVDVHKSPTVFAGDLGAETVDLIVGALDPDDVGAVDERTEHLPLLKVRGDEDIALEAGICGVGGDGVGQIAGRGTGHDLESEFTRTAQRHRDHAILKGEGRIVDGVILDPELADAELLG